MPCKNQTQCRKIMAKNLLRNTQARLLPLGRQSKYHKRKTQVTDMWNIDRETHDYVNYDKLQKPNETL